MNLEFFEFLLSWPKSYISGADIRHILDKSNNSRYGIIKRAIQKKYLIPLRRDFYLINKLKKELIDTFEIAPLIYGPSYISLESALSYHGWIPEAVRTTTCATVKRSKEFTTAVGIFSFERIPIEVFSFGVKQSLQKNGTILFIASPVKALADLIYVRKRSWGTIEDLFGDLRIESENFEEVDRVELEKLIENYPSLKVKKMLLILLKGIV